MTSSWLRMRCCLCALLMGLAWAIPARATSNEELARSYFNTGNAEYAHGSYDEALRAFQAGYALVPRSVFLFNIGQCMRQLGDLAPARDHLVRFLASLGADDPKRAQVSALIAELDVKLAGANPAPTPSVPEVVPAVALQAPLAPAPAPRKHASRKLLWLIAPAAVVIAGVAVGVYFGVRPKSCSDQGYVQCVSLQP